MGIAISTKCESCIGLHIEHLIRLGATRKEIVEVLSVCSYMGGGPSIMFSAKALEAFDQLVKNKILGNLPMSNINIKSIDKDRVPVIDIKN